MMNPRTSLPVVLAIAVLGLTACGGGAAQTPDTKPVAATSTPSPSPSPTLSALDKSICRAYETAMVGRAPDQSTSIRRIFETGAMLAIYKVVLKMTVEDLAALPSANDDDLAAGLLDMDGSLRLLGVRVNAYEHSDGVLEIVEEYSAFRAADRAVQVACKVG